LGHGVTLSEATPRKVTELQGLGLGLGLANPNPDPDPNPNPKSNPDQVTELQGVRMKRLSCGAQHTLFLSAQVTLG